MADSSKKKNTKKTEQRKLSTKAKRAARKTLAGVLLVSSLIVASIPADNSGVAFASNINEVMDYEADRALARNGELLVSSTEISGALDPSSQTQYTSYEIRQVDGEWTLLWKYKYFVPANVGGNTGVGVISDYNDTYNVSTLNMTGRIITGYELIGKSAYDTYVTTDINPITFTLDVSPYVNGTDGTKVTEVPIYFEDAYNTWKSEYDTKLSNYFSQNPGETDAPELSVLGMTPLVLSGDQMTDEMKRIYYCDHSYNNEHTALLTGYTLVPVVNYARGLSYVNADGAVNVIPDEDTVYVAVRNSDTASNANLDENGFKYLASQGIIAIGDGAFADTQKVDVMNVGEGIAFIGDEAFRNSFIKEVQFASVTHIGNQVFQGCQYLEEIHLAVTTSVIGREAFQGCKILESVTIPAGVTDIGFGAFADCSVLNTVDFSGNHGVNIGEYAFYNCPYLTNVIFTPDYEIAIGKAAFALAPGSGTNARLVDFAFPEKLKTYVSAADSSVGYTLYDEEENSYTSAMGDYILANRNNLTNVTMPLNFGSSVTERVPMNTFDMCPDLGCLSFAANNNREAVFDSNLFEDVVNEDFYVFGPETSNTQGPDGQYYAYPRRSTWKANTNTLAYVPYVYYSDGRNHYEVGIEDYRYELEINEDDTATLLSCEFIVTPAPISELVVPGNVAGYDIVDMADGSLDGIKDYIVKLVVADDSISEIGNNVFSDCERLEEVVLGNSVSVIGDNAFSDNLLLTDVTIGENISSIGNEAFADCPVLKNVYWDSPSDYSMLGTLGTDAFTTTSPSLYFHGDIAEGYQPFEYAMGDNKINDDSVRICYVSHAPGELSVIMDEESGYVTLIDYPHYFDLPVELRTKYESGTALNDEELALLDATLYINLPAEIESIDVASFLDSDANNQNRTNWIYIEDSVNYGDGSNNSKRDIYGDANLTVPNSSELLSDFYESGYTPGLFSGYTNDTTPLTAYGDAAPSSYETKGNDWILSVAMPGVAYIPDGAFDSCERLQSVIISQDCSHIGDAAFQNCMDLTSVGTNGNPTYLYDNYIIYETLSDGSYEIAMCLPARGENRSSTEIWVNSDNDPMLDNVSSMQESAFSSCEYITKVDLSDTSLTDVPTDAFRGCKTLTDVELPTTVRNIAQDAFADGADMLDITVPCDSQISDRAFYEDATVTLWTYPECGITSNYEPANDAEVYIKYLDTVYTITFLNDDLSVYEQIEVDSGRNGYYPDNDPAPRLPGNAGYVFDHWYFDNPNEIRNVTENRQAIAVFVPASSGSTSQNGTGNNNGGNGSGNNGGNNGNGNGSGSNNGGNGGNGSGSNNSASNNNATTGTYRVVVENGAGSGNYRPGQVVTITAYAPASGRVFDRWTTSNSDIGFSNAFAVSTTFIMPTHDVKVTATYRTQTASSNTASGNTSGNRNNNTNSNNNNGSSGGNNGGGSNNAVSGNGGGTDVTVTTETIDNNNKNLASATVAGSTDNFIIKITDSAYASAQVEAALRALYGSNFGNVQYVAFDISLYDETGTRLIENYDSLAVTITIPIPDELVSYAGNNRVGVVVNGVLEERAVRFTTIDGVPCMTFTATHFSPYTIYVDTGNLTMGVTDSTPKTGDGIAMKWFLSLGLACGSAVLFLWKDKKQILPQ
ncbi:MAG: leucine-rich repeat domain-containing protein [Lachnospiraceae bacterium]|nr:leucine-rich repeat domain-containing protein [Lachnospiraceae bacterium]